MTQTPAEVADLLSKMAAASKTFAEAEKSRADADKVRADTDKVRSDTEASKQLEQNKLDVATEDLETKRIANTAARATADAARVDKLITQLTGAVPDISTIGKSTVTFGEGKALRQGEAIALALDEVASEIASAAVGTLKDGLELFVVTDSKIVAALAEYRLLRYEATTLRQKLDAAKQKAETELLSAPTVAPAGAADFAPGAVDAGIVVAAVAGKALTQVASLFELEVNITTSNVDIPAYTVQTAVLDKVLTDTTKPKVRHEWARVTPEDSALIAAIEGLTALDVEVTTTDSRLEAQIKGLGDPAARLAEADKVAKDAKKSQAERDDAKKRAEKAHVDALWLPLLQKARNDLTAVLQKARAFAERVTAAPDPTKPSPISRALAIEPLAKKDAKLVVLVLGGAKAETYQVVVKRRVFWPRIQTSTSVEVDYLLVQGEYIVAAGHATAAASYAGKIDKDGTAWSNAGVLPPS